MSFWGIHILRGEVRGTTWYFLIHDFRAIFGYLEGGYKVVGGFKYRGVNIVRGFEGCRLSSRGGGWFGTQSAATIPLWTRALARARRRLDKVSGFSWLEETSCPSTSRAAIVACLQVKYLPRETKLFCGVRR